MPTKQVKTQKETVATEKARKKNTVKTREAPIKKKTAAKSVEMAVTKKAIKEKSASKKSTESKTVKAKNTKTPSVVKKTVKKKDDNVKKQQASVQSSQSKQRKKVEEIKKAETQSKVTVEKNIEKNQNIAHIQQQVLESKDQHIQTQKESVVKQPEQAASDSQQKQKIFKPEEKEEKIPETKYIGYISINELITVRDLAEKMKLRVGDVLKKLLSMGSLATINQRLDTDTAILLANEFGYDAKLSSIYSEEKVTTTSDDPTKLKSRPPVVTIMGHVDHGKTSLLDAIRSSHIAEGEHGGITQHIGAYKVKTSNGSYITFLDTPGHEAFTAMRSRGAQATDIVILVVSAADGVMPQTVEAINHARAAGVSMIVAVNKIDLPTADPQKIRQELSNYNLMPEEWGGDTIMVDISAKQRINIDSLLEMILLRSEIMELKANPDKNAEGIVVEAKLDSRRGPVATVLVQGGTLRIGDNLVVGTTYGKIRAMADEYGKRFNEAPPSTSVEILGINEPPQAGDKFVVVEQESQAREIAQSRKEKAKADALRPRHHISLQDINSGKTKDLRIILKADVQGSLGALGDALERLSTSEISLKIIHRGAGSITESDVALAVASDALIVGFNLRPDATVERLAEAEGVSIDVYRIIYDLIADVKAAMEGLLDPDMKEKILGKAIVKQVFKLSSHGTISGCSVIDGKVQRGARVRLLRDNVIVFEGSISSLKRFKDDIKEVEKGYECGIGLENFSDVKAGDIMESFTTEKVARKLEEGN
ncbi:MAG: translation initiation factor IF-2 [Endomicrobium sp.]|jgi:translation initiation factor IF-2|nr:translation initiation factor IF-2 [Endomicrobium sp.]